MQDPFREFLRSILLPAIPEEYVNILLSEAPFNAYFKKAFTHKTFSIGVDDSEFNYEVLEKVGDRIYNACFQLWVYELIGQETNVLSVYSNIEKRYVGTEYLSRLADNLGFDTWIKVAEGNPITDKMKEDVFEALIAAIVLSTEDYIVKDLGFVLAKRWLYQVFNTFTKEEIDPKNSSKYVDNVSKINEIWQINNWGTPIYVTLVNSRAAKEAGVLLAAVDLKAPNKSNFPARFRGKILGSGLGKNLTEAKEKASEEALRILGVNFAEVSQYEVVFNRLNMRRIEKSLADRPDILEKLKLALAKTSDVYQEVSIKTLKVVGEFVTQIRVSINGIWRNDSRGRGPTKLDSIINAVNYFIEKINKGQLTV